MDASISIKPPPAATKSLAVRDPVTVREAVATDLARSKTVTPAADGGSGQSDQHPNQHPDQRRDHPDHPPPDLLADPASRDVIYRERDIGAPDRAPDRAHPDQALLRQRAYRPAPAMAAEPAATPADPHADIKA